MASPPWEHLLEQRRLGFLLWNATFTTLIFLLLLPFPFTSSPLSLLPFHLSALIFSLALSLLSTPHPLPRAPIPSILYALFTSLLRLLLGGFQRPFWDAHFRRRVARSLAIVVFLLACGMSGFLGLPALYSGGAEGLDWRVVGSGLRGVGVGLVYGVCYVYGRRCVLRFPIVQRPLFFSFKMGLLSSFQQAMKLLTPAFLSSVLLSIFLPSYMKTKATFAQFIVGEIKYCIGTAVIIFCWEVSHNLLQVVYTRRSFFAPPQGSAAAETNPSEPLLERLERSSPRSHLQYLAYLDLCLVCESNVEPWRRAAFFEETGVTYKRIIASCLRPLEQLTSRIGDVLDVYSEDKIVLLSPQSTPITDSQIDLKLQEAFDDFQLCTWAARAAATLTARSHSDDRFGVAQLSGCNASVVTSLLSCLLAVEVSMGKKTSSQPAHLFGPSSIRWAIPNVGRSMGANAIVTRKKSVALHGKAYAMADVLRTSVYEIVSTFEPDMRKNANASVLERNWITDSKPLYGTKEIIVQMLALFLEFQA